MTAEILLNNMEWLFVLTFILRDTYQHLFSKDGELNEYLPKTIKKSLGPPAVEVVSYNEEISRRESKIKELENSRKSVLENQKENIIRYIEAQQEEINQLEAGDE